MIEIHNPLLPAVGSALDALVMNQSLLAQNIANANTEGFISSRLDFAGYMDAVLQLNDVSGQMSPSVEGFVKSSTKEVSQDFELAAMQENMQRFKAIVDVMNRQSGIMQLAMKGRVG